MVPPLLTQFAPTLSARMLFLAVTTEPVPTLTLARPEAPVTAVLFTIVLATSVVLPGRACDPTTMPPPTPLRAAPPPVPAAVLPLMVLLITVNEPSKARIPPPLPVCAALPAAVLSAITLFSTVTSVITNPTAPAGVLLMPAPFVAVFWRMTLSRMVILAVPLLVPINTPLETPPPAPVDTLLSRAALLPLMRVFSISMVAVSPVPTTLLTPPALAAEVLLIIWLSTIVTVESASLAAL